MAVSINKLVANEVYYKVGHNQSLIVDTWIYLGRKGNVYYLCSWWKYFEHVEMDKKSVKTIQAISHFPHEDKKTKKLVLQEFVTKDDLISMIERTLRAMEHN